MDCSPPMEFSDGTTLMSESEKELNSFMMRVKEESGTAGLKLNYNPFTKHMPHSNAHGGAYASSECHRFNV